MVEPASTDESIAEVMHQLQTRVIGRKIRHVRTTGSTNEDLKRLARLGATEGLVLSADEQTEGRGRRGRRWEAPTGTCLLTSTLLRPSRLATGQGFILTMLAAVACAEAIEENIFVPVNLKWPNDLQIAGLKIGGILVESESAHDTFKWAVVGIGLNVNWDPATIPELATTATSLSTVLGRSVSRARLLRSLLQKLDARYDQVQGGESELLFETWRDRLTTLGLLVRVEHAGTMLEGVADSVMRDGSLVVRDEAGICYIFSSGDVTIRKV